MLIYKVVSAEIWHGALVNKRLDGMPVDLADGYLHFSTAEQLRETCEKHFAGQHDLVLIAVDTERLDAALKWETSRGGALFPHLYAPLDPDLVALVAPLVIDDNGRHILPEGIA
jgi:uncharacterized protein (DUF952 family)